MAVPIFTKVDTELKWAEAEIRRLSFFLFIPVILDIDIRRLLNRKQNLSIEEKKMKRFFQKQNQTKCNTNQRTAIKQTKV